MRGRTLRFAGLVAFALGSLGAVAGSHAARADHCEGEKAAIIVFSRIGFGTDVGGLSGAPAYDNKTWGCDAGEEPNTAYITPGTNELLVRYNQDLKVPSVEAKLEGLGYNKVITLKRGFGSPQRQAQGMVLGGAGAIYDSPPLPIGPGVSGKFTVTVLLPEGPVSDSYRTVGT